MLTLEDPSVLVPENGEEHLVLQLELDRIPLDIEGVRAQGRTAVLQDVSPPRIAASRDAHVVGHDVHDLSHPVGAEDLDQSAVVSLGSELRVEPPVISYVVAVRSLGAREEQRREMAVGDAESRKIGHQAAEIGEAQVRPQLEPVGRGRNSRERPRVALESLKHLIRGHGADTSVPYSIYEESGISLASFRPVCDHQSMRWMLAVIVTVLGLGLGGPVFGQTPVEVEPTQPQLPHFEIVPPSPATRDATKPNDADFY